MKKIVYIVGGLYQPSGMGQVLSCKVNYLAEHTDWQIYVVLTERPDLPFFYNLVWQSVFPLLSYSHQEFH